MDGTSARSLATPFFGWIPEKNICFEVAQCRTKDCKNMSHANPVFTKLLNDPPQLAAFI